MWMCALTRSTMYLIQMMLRLTSLVTPVGVLSEGFLGGAIIPRPMWRLSATHRLTSKPSSRPKASNVVTSRVKPRQDSETRAR